MPALTAADAALILDHVVGDPSFPAALVDMLLDKLPFPSNPTPRLLRQLDADPVSASSLRTIQLLASLPASASAVDAARIAVAAFLVASSFDSTANRAAAEDRVRDLLAAEWAAIGPSKLAAVAERIVGDGAVHTWRAADDATRAKFRILVGEEKTREMLAKLEEPSSSANPISTPAAEKMIEALKTSCADLRSVVEDPLPAAKAVADEVLAARMEKRVILNAGQVRSQQTTFGAAGPSTLNDKDQWEDSPDLEGSESSLRRPRLPSPRRLPVSLQPPENMSNRRKARKWSSLEEETLRTGVQQYGEGKWKRILDDNPDVFIGRTPVDLKDKWRNMKLSGQN